MPAVGTQSIRKIMADLLVKKVNEGLVDEQYFIGVGKSDEYNATDTPTTPLSNVREEMIARSNLQAVKKVTDCSFVVRRFNWSSGAIYSAWSDTFVEMPLSQPAYVFTETNDVYVCLQQGKNALGQVNTSTVQPDYNIAGVGETKAFRTSDGYVWKFLFSVTASDSFKYLSANFLPIKTIEDSNGIANTFDQQQFNIQQTAIPGQILGVRVLNPGSGFTSTPTVVIEGDGANASATATIVGGSIAKIEMNNESAAMGSGYSFGSINFVGGGGVDAVAQPIVSPPKGIGANALDDLQSSSVMFTIKPDGAEGGAWLTTNDFRQITLFKNLLEYDSVGIVGNTAASALRYMIMTQSAEANGFLTDIIIQGRSSGARAFVDLVDTNRIYYHQNDTTGFAAFQTGEFVDEVNGDAEGQISSPLEFSQVDPRTGDCLFIENRGNVVRAETQQEDIKVIITL